MCLPSDYRLRGARATNGYSKWGSQRTWREVIIRNYITRMGFAGAVMVPGQLAEVRRLGLQPLCHSCEDRQVWVMNANPEEPMYLQLVKVLTQEILSGRLPAGTKLPERWVAQEYKAARPSVRNALHLLGAQGLVHRVSPRRVVVADVEVDQRRYPGVPMILVRDRRYPQAAVPMSDSWYGEIRAGVRAAAKNMGCNVYEEVIADSSKVPLKEYVAPRPGEVGGVVLCGTYDEQYIEMYRSERVPLVVVDYWAHDLMTDCVCVDVEAEAYTIVDLLARKGHSSLGFMAGARQSRGDAPSYEYDPDIPRMLEHLRTAGRGRHIDIRDEWCLLVHGSGQLAQAVHGYFSMQRRPTALVCFCPVTAEAVLQTAEKAGLRCPEDFSLVTRCVEHVGGRAVTSVVMDPCMLGRAAVKLLAERMRGLRSQAVKQVFSPRLVMGTTVGPAPVAG